MANNLDRRDNIRNRNRDRNRSDRRVVKYKKRRNINVGVLIFASIFVYFIIYIAMFLTRDRISVYEVVYGKTAESSNKYYEGLIIRDETAFYAPSAGYLNCFVREGEKVAVGSTVYTIDENGSITELLQETLEESNTLTDENYASIKNMISEFSLNYDDTYFNSVYDFKVDIAAALLEYINLNAINDIIGSMSNENLSLFNMIKAEQSGIVTYYVDGYEDKTVDNLIVKDFDKNAYSRTSSKSNDLVAAGSPIYKTVNSEHWDIIIPLSEEDVTKYHEDTRIKIRFEEDGITAVGDFEIIYISGQAYGRISLEQYMVRYVSERFINIQIVEEPVEGLKIPKTALVTLDFYVIPERFATLGGNTADIGFLVEKYDEDGNVTVEYINPTIYDFSDGQYYVSTEVFSSGQNLILEDNSEKYTISAKASLNGVYNINNGYCVFREVRILDSTNDYYIVESGTSYGLLVYDHIVLDSSTVRENQVVYH